MRTLRALPTLLVPILASADFYKWDGPDGRIRYFDPVVHFH